ncbi:MAG: alpha/beta fold hydrolase, partial [Bacteroidota bacterium]
RFYLATYGLLAPQRANQTVWKLFSRPQRRSYHPSENALLQQAMQLQHEYQGQRLQGYLWGQGRKQVWLAHGWQSHVLDFKHLIPALLAEGYQVVSFDMPAHGRSEGKLANPPIFSAVWGELSEKLGVPYAVIGHSMGANALTHFFSSRWEGEAVSRFVALAPPTNPPGFFYQFCRQLRIDQRKAEELIDLTKSLTGSSPRDFVMFDRFAQLQAESVMVAYDEDDRVVPRREMKELQQAWPQAQFVTTQGLQHNGLLRDPALREQIIEFLR